MKDLKIYINRLLLVFFGPIRGTLVHNLPAYVKTSPPADTSKAGEASEKGNVREGVDGGSMLAPRCRMGAQKS